MRVLVAHDGYGGATDAVALVDAIDRPTARVLRVIGDPADQVIVRKSNQVNVGASRGSFSEPAPRSARTQPPDVVVGESFDPYGW